MMGKTNIISSNKDYLNKILKIAVPLILGNIISQIQMLVDRAFLGHVNDMYMSALGNVNSPVWTSMSFAFSLGAGASILISQSVGSGKKDDIELYAAALMKWSHVIPVILFFFWLFFGEKVFMLMGVSDTILPMCMDYLKYYIPVFLVVGFESSASVIMQTSNYTKPLVYYGLVRAGLNVLLDWILIFGKFGFPEMGIKGAAIATTIAEYLGCVYALMVFLMSKNIYTRPSFKAIVKASLKPYIKSVGLGINTALEDFAWNFGNLILIRILNTINEKAAGIYSIIFGIEVLAVVAIGSIGSATMTLSGEAKGAGDVKQYKQVCGIAYVLSVICAVILLIVCLIMPERIISIFSNDGEVIQSGALYLLLMCVNLYGKSANIIIGNSIRGSGDTKWMFITQIFGTFFVVGLAALFVFVFKFGIAGVFLAVIVDELVRAFVNLGKFRYITKTFV